MKVKVSSAIVVDGVVQVPGAEVELSATDARALVSRGKAVPVEGADDTGGADNDDDPKSPEDNTGAGEKSAGAKSRRNKG